MACAAQGSVCRRRTRQDLCLCVLSRSCRLGCWEVLPHRCHAAASRSLAKIGIHSPSYQRLDGSVAILSHACMRRPQIITTPVVINTQGTLPPVTVGGILPPNGTPSNIVSVGSGGADQGGLGGLINSLLGG